MARDPSKLYPHDYLMAKVILPFVPSWVSPNMVTVIRLLTIPFVVWLLLTDQLSYALPLFIFSAFTDALDGSMARVRKQITPWGTFYDPVADKLLIGVGVLILVWKYLGPVFATVILTIEGLIIVGGYAYRNVGKMQSANVWGKSKMVCQVVGVTLLLIYAMTGIAVLVPLAGVVLAIAVFLALISLYTYGL